MKQVVEVFNSKKLCQSSGDLLLAWFPMETKLTFKLLCFFLMTSEPALSLGCVEVSHPTGICFYKPKAIKILSNDLADGRGTQGAWS